MANNRPQRHLSYKEKTPRTCIVDSIHLIHGQCLPSPLHVSQPRFLQCDIQIMYLVNFRLLKKSKIKKWPFGVWKFKDKLWFGGHHMMEQYTLIILYFSRWSNTWMFSMFHLKFNRKLDVNHQVKSPKSTKFYNSYLAIFRKLCIKTTSCNF